MNDLKAIICGRCGKRFYVDKDQYEIRKYERTCDACANADRQADEDSNDNLQQISQAVVKGVRIVDRTIGVITESKRDKKDD